MDHIQTTVIEEIQEAVREGHHLLPRGSGSKTALSGIRPGITPLSTAGLSGILSYEPAEYIITALAGTPVSEVQAALRENGQYLPFDPPLSEKGATLGGAVAAGLNGPGRYRYGGMRDFLLAIQFIDGLGRVVKSGGKVVKNAAGFDLPKLMIGSLGRLGILTELTFKVFPLPQAFATLRRKYDQLDEAVAALIKFANAQLDVDSLELDLVDHQPVILARTGGLRSSISKRVELLQQFLSGSEVVAEPEEGELWAGKRNFSWVPEGWYLVKIPLIPSTILDIEKTFLSDPLLLGCRRSYSSGGHQAWIACQASSEVKDKLEKLVSRHNLSALVVWGLMDDPRLGLQPGRVFALRVKQALDPDGRFLEI